MICEDTNLGLRRTNKLVFIQIFQQGRDAETKQALYAALAEQLKEECGVEGNDLIVTVSRNEKEDWSFGNGVAQFLTGDL
jgi:phenylpyruvate tautomerase PptA (4-oxalocrotonate tautomerase family)